MRVLRRLAPHAAHPSNKTDALSLREEGVAFLTCGKGRAAPLAAVDEPHRGPVVAASQATKGNTMNSKPTLIAYTVKERGKGKNDFWVRIGGAWPFEKNGSTGFTIQLDALPLDGRIVLTEPKPAQAEAASETETA
jgi:hypothetical protein